MTTEEKIKIEKSIELIKKASIGDWKNLYDVDNKIVSKLILLSNNDPIEKKVSKFLDLIQMPAHLKGYRYLKKAIIDVIANPIYIENRMRLLYEDIAYEYGTTFNKVERCIRNAIEVTWSLGSVEMLDNILGLTIQSKNIRPTNSKFIFAMAKMIS